MSLLRVLRLGCVSTWFLRKVLFTVAIFDQGPEFLQRFISDCYRVRAHVRNQTDRAVADIDTLVEALRYHHGLLRTEAKFS